MRHRPLPTAKNPPPPYSAFFPNPGSILINAVAANDGIVAINTQIKNFG
jgi:hypothetical protein